MTRRQRTPGAAAMARVLVPVPMRPGPSLALKVAARSGFGTFPRSGAQRRAEGCAPANPPTDAVYTMLTQQSCMAAVVCVFYVVNEAGGAA